MRQSLANLLPAGALLCGLLLPPDAGAEACTAIRHEILQVDAGRDEWTSAHTRIRPNDVILVYAGGAVQIAGDQPAAVTPKGRSDGIGGLEMRVGSGTIVPTGSRWFGSFRDYGTLKFRVLAGARAALTGRYKVNLVVIPAGVFPDPVVFDDAAR